MNEAFTTIAIFQYSSEALIVKGRFEAEGIETFLRDQHTIDTDPLVSNAIGGVKLNIRREDEAKALEVLESINRYSLDDTGVAITCPKCGSKKVDLQSNVKDVKSLMFFMFSFLLYVLPIYIKYEYRCENCKNKFNLK
ncbi:hypothetical protein GCM10007103_27900 [Salinimicrobium marinum]|uniref:Signal transducing protein n=1 Tax=Salinimicrobium marinum TaxID=680283 RepID=A0A918W1L9_9FLAO|nr:DUF2007 domain-containing protein [Salinimicrobium marinum]GHA45115.1 hypothetical protein GCM10007103_27900 [Salinimicrobium marinum]